MNQHGVLASMTVESPTDGDVFLAYLDHVLCPQLRPGQVAVMDKLATHQVPGVRERIEKVGAELLYLPPYSRRLGRSFVPQGRPSGRIFSKALKLSG